MDLAVLQFHKFVGRRDEIEKLTHALEGLSNKKGRMVFIKGEVGVGKTKLVKNVLEAFGSPGIRVLRGKCMFLERADPFLPVYQALREHCKRDSPDQEIRESIIELLPSPYSPETQVNGGPPEQRSNLLPLGLIPMSGNGAGDPSSGRDDMGPLLGLSPMESDVISEEHDRDQLFERLFSILASIAKNGPMVLFIDDLHWADTGTMEFLQYLSTRIFDQSFMVILAYRSEEIARSDMADLRMEAITNMIREDAVEQIELGRLSRDEVSDLLCATFDLEEIPKGFLDRIYDRTEGNPFFIQEVLRGLVNEGVIDVTGYTWLNQVDMSKVSIPSTLEEMVSRRMGRLSPDVLKVLKYASIIGLQFNFKDLLALVARPEEEVLDALDELIDQRLVHEEGGSDEESYRFDNAIIRDLAYASLSKSRKRLIHNKIGEIMETEHGNDITPVIFDLAYHFKKGKEFRKALYYMIKAGEGASAIYAYHEALKYFSDAHEALEHLESNDGNAQIREGLLFNIGYCEETLGNWDNALEHYNRAQQLTTLSRHMKLHGQILRHIGDVHRRKGDYGLADISYKNAVSAARIAKDYHTLAESYRGLGYISWRRGRYSKATKEYETSIKYARKIKDHSIIALIFIEVGNLYNSKGQTTKALDHYHRALDILERSGDMFDITRAYNNIGDVYLGREDYGKAVEFFRQSERYARKVGNINMAYWALFNTAEALAKLGELEKAMDLCGTAEAGLRKQDDKIGICYTNMIFGIIHGKMGDLKLSRASFDESIRTLKSMDVPQVLAEVFSEKGLVLLEAGEKEEGRSALEESLRLFDSVNAGHRSGKVRQILDASKNG